MQSKPLAILLLLLPACVVVNRPLAVAPAQEAERIEAPFPLPVRGGIEIEANMAAAIQLAMDDFLPWDVHPPQGERVEQACLYRREAYDVSAAPSSEGLVLVRFIVNGDVCPPDPTLSVEAASGLPVAEVTTYAVDVRTMRVLAIDMHLSPWGRP